MTLLDDLIFKSQVGCISSIKVNILPHLLYPQQMLPLYITKKLFKEGLYRMAIPD